MIQTNQKPFPLGDLQREILKITDRYCITNESEILDVICLQRDINTFLSEVIVSNYNVSEDQPNVIEDEVTDKDQEAILTIFKELDGVLETKKPEDLKDIKVIAKAFAEAYDKVLDDEPDTKKQEVPKDVKDIGKVFVDTFNQVGIEMIKDISPQIEKYPTPFDTIPVEENKHTTIYIIDLPFGKYAITSYQFEKQKIESEYGQVILGATESDEEWVIKNEKHIKKYPELFQKFVEDKLPYEDFLYLEGFVDCELDGDSFMIKKGVEVEPLQPVIVPYKPVTIIDGKEITKQIVDDPTPFDNIDGDLIFTNDKPVHPLDIITPVAVTPLPKAPVKEVPKKPEFKLTDHQQLKFDGLIEKIDSIIQSQRNLVRPPNPAYYMTVLEGAAGTGKTTMMVKVLEHLTENYDVIFCSPTHQALGVIRETLMENWVEFTENNDEYLLRDQRLIIKTLASFLGIKMKRDEENGTESFEEDPKAPILTCDVLCIDESSMISKDQIKILLKKLHINVKCILFIGDEVQLDSPSDNNESNGIFQLPQKFALEEVVRQAADNKILQLAWELRGYILAKNCPYAPSQLLHAGRANENIYIYKDQQLFMQDYFQNQEPSKLIATYTNKITNEYNEYVRQLRLTGTGVPLNVDIDGNGKNVITDWNEYKEWYVGEECVALEPNQRAGEVIHQTGEKFIIKTIREETKKIFIEVAPDTSDLMAEITTQEFIIPYWRIEDTNGKTIWIVKKEFQQQYNDILALLTLEAKRKTGKFKWSKYWDIKEKFTRVNKTFGFTLHKLQGSTCKDIYVDARDLDKFWQRMPVGVYKLIYIALTRPKNRVHFLV